MSKTVPFKGIIYDLRGGYPIPHISMDDDVDPGAIVPLLKNLPAVRHSPGCQSVGYRVWKVPRARVAAYSSLSSSTATVMTCAYCGQFVTIQG